MNKQNNLPKYWVVRNTNNDEFKVVLNYLFDTYGEKWHGLDKSWYYGYDGSNYYKDTKVHKNIETFINNPTLLTLEEFKKAINMEEEFVLPEKWCVRSIGKDEYQKYLEPYIANDYFASRWYGKDYYYHFKIGRLTKANNSLDINYTEITFEQFKKYVLKMNDNKKIIEYRVKEQFKKHSEALFKECKNDTKGGFGRFDYDSNVRLFFKEAGVLDLWFEPIYEEEVKTINMGSFNLTIKNKKVFHKNEDITQYVKDLVRMFANLPISIGGKACTIKQIVFQDNGCEKNNNTTLDDWLKVFDMIK